MANTQRVEFRQLRIIHASLVLGTLMFCGITYYLKLEGIVPMGEFSEAFAFQAELIVPLFAAVVVGLLSFYVFRSHLGKTVQIADLQSKLQRYRSSLIIRYAGVEIGAYACIVGYMMTARNNLILYAILLVVLLIYLRPLRTRIQDDLDLTDEEIQSI